MKILTVQMDIKTKQNSQVTYNVPILCVYWTPPLKPLSYSLENWPWKKHSTAVLTHLPGVYFFKSTFFQCGCVHKKWGLTRRPPSWLTTSGRSSVGSKIVRNRGATPKCHHSCKTAEHKSQITEICTPRPPDNENRGAFERLLPENGQWKLSCVMFHGTYYEQETPDSTAAGRHQCGAALVAVWEFILSQPHC